MDEMSGAIQVGGEALKSIAMSLKLISFILAVLVGVLMARRPR
jgi:hypothetical protein